MLASLEDETSLEEKNFLTILKANWNYFRLIMIETLMMLVSLKHTIYVCKLWKSVISDSIDFKSKRDEIKT